MNKAGVLLERNLLAAERVAERLGRSVHRISGEFPLTGQGLGSLDEEQLESIDAFIKRFEQLQDAIASRLFRGIAIAEQEDVTMLSRRDLALLMEKLRVIPSADEWSRLSILRNQLAHEYPDEPEKQAERLNEAFSAALKLIALTSRIREYADSKGFTAEST